MYGICFVLCIKCENMRHVHTRSMDKEFECFQTIPVRRTLCNLFDQSETGQVRKRCSWTRIGSWQRCRNFFSPEQLLLIGNPFYMYIGYYQRTVVNIHLTQQVKNFAWEIKLFKTVVDLGIDHHGTPVRHSYELLFWRFYNFRSSPCKYYTSDLGCWPQSHVTCET